MINIVLNSNLICLCMFVFVYICLVLIVCQILLLLSSALHVAFSKINLCPGSVCISLFLLYVFNKDEYVNNNYIEVLSESVEKAYLA